jgi:hypothetical protein
MALWRSPGAAQGFRQTAQEAATPMFTEKSTPALLDSDPSLEEALRSTESDVLKAVASDPKLGEDFALTLLKRTDLPSDTLAALSRNAAAMKSRKVKLALAQHLRTPRHISLPMMRHLFTFDLMRVALAPVVPADIKMAADEALMNRLETLSTGERLSLARQASGRIAGALLSDPETRIMTAALENPRLTESAIIHALTRGGSTAAFVEAVCHHSKWSLRREIRMALLRNAKTPLARALEFARSLPSSLVQEILDASHLPGNIQTYLRNDLNSRRG